MRSFRIAGATVTVTVAAIAAVAAQKKAPSPLPPASQVSVVARIDTGRDVFFAPNAYTFTRLLRLQPDGTFTRYPRHHMFVAIDDGGQWRQSDDGTLRLCSHYHHEPIRAGELTVWVREGDTANLSALASTLEKLLEAHPSKKRFSVGDLRVQAYDATAPRSHVVALIAAIRSRLANRDGTMTTHRVMRFDNITWFSEFDPRSTREVEKDLFEEYRRHKEGPFLPGSATVEVDAKTFQELLGTTQGFMFRTEMNQVIPRDAALQDKRRNRLAAPECGGF